MGIIYTEPENNGKDGYWCYKHPTSDRPGVWMTTDVKFNPFHIRTGKEEGIPDEILALMEKWREESKDWGEPSWYVKYASEEFIFNDVLYNLDPSAIGIKDSVMDVNFMRIERDLEELGCPYYYYSGMLD